MPAPARKEKMQGVQGIGHLRAPADKEHMQGVQGIGHLRAPAPKEPMQAMQGIGDLRAPAPAERMQGMQGIEHLRAPAPKELMQGMPRCSICPQLAIRMSERSEASCDANKVSSCLADFGSLFYNLVVLVNVSTAAAATAAAASAAALCRSITLVGALRQSIPAHLPPPSP